jgi:hypothetical protein
VATLSGGVVTRQAVEATAHELRRDGAPASRGQTPPSTLATMAHDDLEAVGVDARPLAGHMRGPMLSRRVRHRRPTPVAEAQVHRYPGSWLWTKAMLHIHSRVAKHVPRLAAMTSLPLGSRRMGTLHGNCLKRRVRIPHQQGRRGPEGPASGLKVRQATGRRREVIIGVASAGFLFPTSKLTPTYQLMGREEGRGMREREGDEAPSGPTVGAGEVAVGVREDIRRLGLVLGVGAVLVLTVGAPVGSEGGLGDRGNGADASSVATEPTPTTAMPMPTANPTPLTATATDPPTLESRTAAVVTGGGASATGALVSGAATTDGRPSASGSTSE